MSYDAWKTRTPEDDSEPPDERCDVCHAGPLEDCAEDCACDWCKLHRHPWPALDELPVSVGRGGR